MGLGPPDLIRIHWGDAQDVCAFDIYPLINFIWGNQNAPWAHRVQPGQISGGAIIEPPPADQFDAFEKVIVPMFRPDLANAKVVNKEKMPEVAKAVYDQINTDPDNYVVGVAVGRETFEYDLNGQTVQEVIGGVYKAYTSKRWGFVSWSLVNVSSKRAPKGELDQLKPISDIMVQSLEMNPEWNQRLAALLTQRQQQTAANQQQQAERQNEQFNAIESRISAQTAANDAQHASYWQHSADLERQSDREADVQREVSPWRTSDGGSVKLPNQYGHAWEGADGEIIMSNDAQYNPNSDGNTHTTWTSMEQEGIEDQVVGAGEPHSGQRLGVARRS